MSCQAVPLKLHSDQGHNLLGMKETRKTPLHPQCVEKIAENNRTIINYLSLFVSDTNVIRTNTCLYSSCVTEAPTGTGYTQEILLTDKKVKLPIGPHLWNLMGIYKRSVENNTKNPWFHSKRGFKLEPLYKRRLRNVNSLC